MNDNDMIRRGDALECFMGLDRTGDIMDAIADLPAEAMTTEAALALPKIAALVEAATAQLQYMDMCNDKGDLERNLRAALAAIKEPRT